MARFRFILMALRWNGLGRDGMEDGVLIPITVMCPPIVFRAGGYSNLEICRIEYPPQSPAVSGQWSVRLSEYVLDIHFVTECLPACRPP